MKKAASHEAGEAGAEHHEARAPHAGRVEARLGPGRPLRAQHRLLGRLRAAGQHHAALGRPNTNWPTFLGFNDAHHLVPVLQPADDLPLRAAPEHPLGLAGQAGRGALERDQDGHRLRPAGRLLHRHDRRRAGSSAPTEQGQPRSGLLDHLASSPSASSISRRSACRS